jgi:hypothetical protein
MECAHDDINAAHTSNPRFDDDIHSTRCLILYRYISVSSTTTIFLAMFVFSSVVDPELFIPDRDPTSEKFGILTLRFCTKSRLFNV